MTLFYPVSHLGGAQLLFVRVACELAANRGWRVSVVDRVDGFIPRMLALRGVEFELIALDRAGTPRIQLKETTLLLGLGELPGALARLSGDAATRIFLWSLHPHNALAYFCHGYVYNRLPVKGRPGVVRLLEPLRWRRVRALFATLAARRALAYMDGANARYPATLGLEPPAGTLLPIPVPSKTLRVSVPVPRRALRVGWLGRVAEDKLNTIVATLELCMRYAQRHGVEFDYHVIGGGPALSRLRASVFPGVRLQCAGELSSDVQDRYLAEHLQAGFAMGTSIIEIALLGIPVVVVDYSNRAVRSDALALRWASQIEDFTLGEVIGERPLAARISMDDIVRVCQDPLENRAVGEAGRAYAAKHHSIESVCGQLEALLEGTQYTLEEARALIGSRSRPLGPSIARGLNRICFWNRKP